MNALTPNLEAIPIYLDPAPKPFDVRRLAPFWNFFVPKRALGMTVGPDPKRPGAIRYRHATKGWRSVSAKRLAAVGV